MRDIVSNVGVAQVVAPVVLTATTTSEAMDLLGFNAAVIVVNTGAIAGAGDFTAKLQDSDTPDDSPDEFEDVPAAQLQGVFPESLAENAVVKVGYAGFKRYVRLVVTKNSGTSIAACAVLVKGQASERPIS